MELLEGVVVAMAPQDALRAAEIAKIHGALSAVAGESAHVRSQLPLVAGRSSVPEPDFAVVEGQPDDYRDAHPRTALLVVEVVDSSLPQDRLTKARIYAAAGIPEYWIANLRDARIEVLRHPDAERRLYQEVSTARLGDTLSLLALARARIRVADLLPPA